MHLDIIYCFYWHLQEVLRYADKSIGERNIDFSQRKEASTLNKLGLSQTAKKWILSLNSWMRVPVHVLMGIVMMMIKYNIVVTDTDIKKCLLWKSVVRLKYKTIVQKIPPIHTYLAIYLFLYILFFAFFWNKHPKYPTELL